MIGHGTSPFPPVRRCTTADKTLSNTSTCIYADDSQIYGFCRPLETVGLQDRVSACIGDVSLWMTVNWLQFNPSKTEVLWCSSSCRQHQIPSRPFRIGSTAVSPVSSVRDLGVHIYSDLTMRSHVVATVRSCFAALHQIRSVRRSLTPEALLTLVHALVVSKVDYCNSVLAGVSAHLLRHHTLLTVYAVLLMSTVAVISVLLTQSR